jgi:prepilin signal peptidase PulO-like enzyme (type II secretory pathway)
MALAAVFPWYITDLPFMTGPFYDMIADADAIQWVFPIHLSVLFNGALITSVILVLVLGILNVSRKDISFPRMFSSYRTDVKGLTGKHFWVILEHKKKKKVEPTQRIERRLKARGDERVWVTPKIPFILSLFIGYGVQMTLGNLIAIMFLWL